MKNLAWLVLGVIAGCAGAMGGCGGDVNSSGSGGSGGSGGGSSTGGSTSTASGTSASTGSGPCGGAVCGPTEYCDYGRNQCGANGEIGGCKPRPDGCPKSYIATCGCDGAVYGGSCDAASKGSDVSDLGGCVAPAGSFACGSIFCAKGQQYCQKTGSDIGGEPDSYICVSMPNACFQGAPPTCTCLAGEPCGSLCEATADGDLIITCLGG